MDIVGLLKTMTLVEKLGQLSQYASAWLDTSLDSPLTGPKSQIKLTDEEYTAIGSTFSFKNATVMKKLQEQHLKNDPKKIPLLFMDNVVHGYRTIYPVPLGMSATFDVELVEECCAMAAKEAVTAGVHVTFAPMVDVSRDARWGRCVESAGEDPYLNSEMGRAQVRGYQGNMDPSKNIAACVKHYAAYGQAEAGRDYNTTDMSERTLRDFYLPAYQATVDEDVRMVMTSFNALNGVPSSGNKWLVKDILRDEWGFDGVVISDFKAFDEMRTHGYCETESDCAEKAMNATSDIEMMSACYFRTIPALIEQGKLSMQQIDEAVLRVLKLKEELGLFENPYSFASEEESEKVCLCAEHRALAKKAVVKSAVLLKNENILPFDKNKAKRIAVIGPFGDYNGLDQWACRGRNEDVVTVLQGIKNLLPNKEIVFARGCGDEINATDCSDIEAAVATAKSCDTVILCVGERADFSCEGKSRMELRLSKAQKTLINEIVKVNKNTAVVLYTGRPLVLTDCIDDMPALMTAWLPGTEGGNAIAELLFGDENFSGKLSMTFPRSEGQLPISYNAYKTGRPLLNEDNWARGFVSCYFDMPNTPLFSFGYGLSYTDFEISVPEINKTEMNSGETLTVSVKVKNIGKRNGETVLQLYICDEFASLVRPIKELKGFKKIELKPNEERAVSFEITEDMLKFWSANGKFEAESGSFRVWVSDVSTATENVRFVFSK
ncbi:MAG: glycoside hydrolase family 3 C-terminal domain-containing protein [Clostridia bacterium]|nr:glycoside hydrolase family 3 C-terminal domain-containing protein [Clostridia bacterium]